MILAVHFNFATKHEEQIPITSVAHARELVDATPVGRFWWIDLSGEAVATEATLKPSQILRLGQVEVRLEADQSSGSPAGRKMTLDHTQVVPQGIKMGELDQTIKMGNPGFEKKSNKGTKIFIVAAIVFGVVGLGVLIWVVTK